LRHPVVAVANFFPRCDLFMQQYLTLNKQQKQQNAKLTEEVARLNIKKYKK